MTGPDKRTGVENVRPDYLDDPKFRPILEHYWQSLERYLEALQTFEANDDAQSIVDATHKLTGTAANYGYPRIAEAAENCENLLSDGASLDQAKGQIVELRKSIKDALTDRK